MKVPVQVAAKARQSGAMAVEFAFVFPFLFILLYATIVYSYLFVIQEAITYAAQEAAEAAVAVDPSDPGAAALRTQRVRATAVSTLSWLPNGQKTRVLGDDTGSAVSVTICEEGSSVICPPDTAGVIVTLNFQVTSPTALFPVIEIPNLFTLPPLPAVLTATAVARI